MTLQELQDALLVTDPSALLVPQPLIDHVIQQVYKLPTRLLNVPHRKSVVLDRHLLFHYVDPEDLELPPDRLLLPTVILLARPSVDRLRRLDDEAILLQNWQTLFHAKVHLTLRQRLGEAGLTARDIRERIEQIGRLEWQEIRSVLKHEQMLFPTADEQETYIEFASVYLEYRFFAANLRRTYFPIIRDFGRIDEILAQDIDAEAIYRSTRLPGTPDPMPPHDHLSEEPSELYWKLMHEAERAERAGNTVRAAILHRRAAQVAPGALTFSTAQQARGDLVHLTERLQAALRLSDSEAESWREALPVLLEKVDQSDSTLEAQLLYDLQNVCVDHEREIFALDIIEWVLSTGKRPIKRPLPGQRRVRITKHLRSASRHLLRVRVPDDDRRRLTQLLQAALHQSEARLRAAFRPILADALHDVGFRPGNPPENVSFGKMVEEMLDRISEYGFLTFADLRDAISRNQLKMPDLADPREFVRGDPLLRLDRRLSTALDGVYRRSEFYLRLLQRFTSLGFGTALGRQITLSVVVPAGAAILLLDGLNELLHRFGVPVPTFGPAALLMHYLMPGGETHFQAAPALGILSFIALVLFVFNLVHSADFRQNLRRFGQDLFRVGRRVLFEWPVQLIPIATLRWIWRSWPMQLVYWYFFKPLLLCSVLLLWFPTLLSSPVQAGLVLAAASLFLNSRLGLSITELIVLGARGVYRWFRSGLVEDLPRLIAAIFKRFTDLVEYVLYSVDEWLRFRGGESWASLTLRAALNLIWFPIAVIVRLYILVLIEPGLNPLKVPVSFVAGKIYVPAFPFVLKFFSDVLTPVLGPFLAVPLASTTAFLLPDAFGFLFWEMKENWKLYRANRAPSLRPAVIGHHGETLVRLLRPGFHSGTIPKLYAQLRKVEHRAVQTGDWTGVPAARQALRDVEECVRLFFDRDFLSLLQQSAHWRSDTLRVGAITLANLRVAVQLEHADFPGQPLRLTFNEQSGWLLAGVDQAGWLAKIDSKARKALTWAIAGVYKLTGVDVVREQIEANVPGVAEVQIVSRQLQFSVASAQSRDERIHYRYDPDRGTFTPGDEAGQLPSLPEFSAERLIFSRQPLTWQTWVTFWQDEGSAEEWPVFSAADLPAAHPQEVNGIRVGKP